MTSPDSTSMTLEELNRAIIDASRELIAAQRSRPRDTERIDAARAELEGLMEQRDLLAGV